MLKFANKAVKIFLFSVVFLIIFNPFNVEARTNENKVIQYKIRTGDTLYFISQKFSTAVGKIKALNPDLSENRLMIGQAVKIRPAEPIRLYYVKKGDTLYKISRVTGIPISAIIKENGIKNKNIINIGDIIVIPKPLRVKVYFIIDDGTDFYLVPEIREIYITTDKYASTLEQLIKDSTIKNRFMTIPKSTKIKSTKLTKGILYINFSDDIYKCNVGSSGEALTLDAIVNTMTEFPEVKKVMLLVNGKNISSLGGHIEIEEPLARNEKSIKR